MDGGRAVEGEMNIVSGSIVFIRIQDDSDIALRPFEEGNRSSGEKFGYCSRELGTGKSKEGNVVD